MRTLGIIETPFAIVVYNEWWGSGLIQCKKSVEL
jgi:hypothetical protein